MGRLSWPSRDAIVVSCEHASARIPAGYRRLGLQRQALRTHVAYDIGAARLARAIAREFRAPCHLGRWSRLLIDLNRSLGHPKLCPAVAFGVPVPGNEAVSAAEKERRVRRFYLPYRAAVRAVVDAVGKHGGSCLHLSVHSFTPVLGAKRRRCDVGLLYDPRRPVERDLVAYWAAELRATGLHVRRNYPYRGQADGLASALRRELPASRYAGVEIEITQALFTSQAQRERIVAAVVEALARILSEAS